MEIKAAASGAKWPGLCRPACVWSALGSVGTEPTAQGQRSSQRPIRLGKTLSFASLDSERYSLPEDGQDLDREQAQIPDPG